jgi:hypothetical protein
MRLLTAIFSAGEVMKCSLMIRHHWRHLRANAALHCNL